MTPLFVAAVIGASVVLLGVVARLDDWRRRRKWTRRRARRGGFVPFAGEATRRRYPDCPACWQGLAWDGVTEHVVGCPERR